MFPGLLEIGLTDLDDTLGSFNPMKKALIHVEESFRDASVQAFFWHMSLRDVGEAWRGAYCVGLSYGWLGFNPG